MKKIKEEIINNYKLLLELGYNIGAEGNISIKDGEDVYITPSGVDIRNLTKEKIAIVDLKGNPKNRIKPSSEIDLHLLLYKERNELSSIVHCHSNWASILSCLRVNILSFHYMVAEFGGDDIKCSKYATFGTKKLAKFVVNSAKNRNGCLIANHGQICFGKNIKEAMHFPQALEKLSKQYYFCILSKKLKKLNKKEMNEVLKIFPSYKSKD